MLSITYVSSASQLFSDDELVALLEQSRAWNTSVDITGMMLYRDGNIMQVLEGPDEAVGEIFARISSDPRHRGLILMLREQIVQRAFPDWSMGFRNVEGIDLSQLTGFSDFLAAPMSRDLAENAPSVHILLSTFRENMR